MVSIAWCHQAISTPMSLKITNSRIGQYLPVTNELMPWCMQKAAEFCHIRPHDNETALCHHNSVQIINDLTAAVVVMVLREMFRMATVCRCHGFGRNICMECSAFMIYSCLCGLLVESRRAAVSYGMRSWMWCNFMWLISLDSVALGLCGKIWIWNLELVKSSIFGHLFSSKWTEISRIIMPRFVSWLCKDVYYLLLDESRGLLK